VTIVGTAFVVIATFERESLGYPGLPLAVVEYPMGGVSTAEAVARGHRAFDEIVAGLTMPGEGT
jgi:hypothetical protein